MLLEGEENLLVVDIVVVVILVPFHLHQQQIVHFQEQQLEPCMWDMFVAFPTMISSSAHEIDGHKAASLLSPSPRGILCM